MAVAEVAKRVGKPDYLARRTDAPIDHALMRVQARREAQQLDQVLGRIVVVIVCVVFDDEAHNMMNLGVKYDFSPRIYCLSSYYFYSKNLYKIYKNCMKFNQATKKS